MAKEYQGKEKPKKQHGANHFAAVAQYQAEHGRDARQHNAKERDEARRARSHEEQLARLDAKLGKGQGAKRERARLLRLIAVGRMFPEQKAAA